MKSGDAKIEEAEKAVVDHCKRIVELTGKSDFHVESTRRQFERYLDGWGGLAPGKVTEQMRGVAAAAVEQLSGDSG